MVFHFSLGAIKLNFFVAAHISPNLFLSYWLFSTTTKKMSEHITLNITHPE